MGFLLPCRCNRERGVRGATDGNKYRDATAPAAEAIPAHSALPPSASLSTCSDIVSRRCRRIENGGHDDLRALRSAPLHGDQLAPGRQHRRACLHVLPHRLALGRVVVIARCDHDQRHRGKGRTRAKSRHASRNAASSVAAVVSAVGGIEETKVSGGSSGVVASISTTAATFLGRERAYACT